MNRHCTRVRKLLELNGAHALTSDAQAADHLLHCDECGELAGAFAALDRAFSMLPGIDAPEDTVARLLARPELEEQLSPAEGEPEAAVTPLNLATRCAAFVDRLHSHRLHLGLTAVPVAVFIACFLVLHLTDVGSGARDADAPQRMFVVKQLKFKQPPTAIVIPKPATRLIPVPDPGPDDPEPVGDGGQSADGAADARQDHASRSLVEGQDAGSANEELVFSDQMDFIADESLILGIPEAPAPPEPGIVASDGKESTVVGMPKRDAKQRRLAETKAPLAKTHPFPEETLGRIEDQIDELDELGEREEAHQLRGQLVELRRALGTARADENFEPKSRVAPALPTASPENTSSAREFLAEREKVDGLSFQEARGYWANTYLPGDRELRRLASRLAIQDRGEIGRLAGHGHRLHDAAALPPQPFDPPDRSALAIYLHADQRAVSARQRLLVEVGLKGSPRRSGSRPAMNIGVVLDLRGEVTAATFERMRALLLALAAQSQPGDRFSLTVAGRPDGLLVPPERFRHGPLTVALAELSEFLGGTEGGLGIDDALTTAYDTVAVDDDPSTPLGSSSVLLVSGDHPIGQLADLCQMAHSRAVNGIPLSVVVTSQARTLEALDELALAGQGNRRILNDPVGADAVVARELEAVGRIVARALRLNLRLAPGVQLVEIVGSHPLNAVATQQVRDAENAIDRRLAHNLGITADRGLDDDGIQIVIPSFYAEDEHVILLDVVVPGPGPVLDAELRYKDLVWFGNGTSSAHLSLNRGTTARTPLELNVLKNLLTSRLATALEHAAAELQRGRIEGARERLECELQLLEGLRFELPGLGADRDLLAHIHLLEAYRDLLANTSWTAGPPCAYLIDSLSYAAHTQLMSPTRRMQ